ncbi:hypothetical protein [Sphingomonas guangdongensis]|nr:hypothetical protein [Sphingomonas guangdongensis]
MASGRINSPESMKMASDVFHAFGGSWEAVEQAAVPRADGVHVIPRRAIADALKKKSA